MDTSTSLYEILYQNLFPHREVKYFITIFFFFIQWIFGKYNSIVKFILGVSMILLQLKLFSIFSFFIFINYITIIIIIELGSKYVTTNNDFFFFYYFIIHIII